MTCQRPLSSPANYRPAVHHGREWIARSSSLTREGTAVFFFLPTFPKACHRAVGVNLVHSDEWLSH